MNWKAGNCVKGETIKGKNVKLKLVNGDFGAFETSECSQIDQGKILFIEFFFRGGLLDTERFYVEWTIFNSKTDIKL